MEGGRAGLEVRRKGMSKVKKEKAEGNRKGMSKVKKEKAEGNRKKEAKKYKNKCRRLRVGAPLSRRLSRRPLPARERNLGGTRERNLGGTRGRNLVGVRERRRCPIKKSSSNV